ncbi:protein-L-isoaspartate(D-aspartate) O-methyltransferase [Jannaschia sp. Os4]|uniref:protein-L-isoaspartate(D-aspartate) O-methyltransferase n=1 Tax=Jannaschia sp. Os4 TaxID=2807617 RepID=UPI00193944BA|nr:protein-L-isoaspartate(D-aspartate) O-methyltransferase [Jannaschia sp. Os4]MBM2576754.1 protein-L-isoaspartate(D-aspartate) O-methyltransferase [Jannaschia sp. Os4]
MTPETVLQLIVMLRRAGVTDKRVLEAMEQVDRARFVPATFRDRAYEDVALPIGAGQTISQPSVVAQMSAALEVGPRDTVLEVGTGSGYHSAVLSKLARRVYTVDRHRSLTREAVATHQALGIPNVTVMTADGSLGWPQQAPFDRILVTAASEDPPGPLLAQLGENGIMVVPVGVSGPVQTLVKVRRTASGFDYDDLGDVRFVPLVQGIEPDVRSGRPGQ